MPKYSVIVPVYNAEGTLERCINSLLNQNYKDAEIILVNDGSIDKSKQICEEFLGKSRQVIVINKENGGVSSARNVGLKRAAGKYVVFVDSDDMVMQDYFQQLDLLDIEEAYDYVWFSYKQIGGGVDLARQLEPCIAKNSDECVEVFSRALGSKVINTPWNKRFTNSIIKVNNLVFPEELSIGEDTVFNLQYAMYCQNCAIFDVVLYAVNVESLDSLSRKVRTDLQDQFKILDEKILQVILSAQMNDSQRERYLAAINYKQLKSIYSEAKRMHISKVTVQDRRKQIKLLCENFILQEKLLPHEMKVWILKIPVWLKMITAIDLMGYFLAKNR